MISKFKRVWQDFLHNYRNQIGSDVTYFGWFNFGLIYTLLFVLCQQSDSAPTILKILLAIMVVITFLNAYALYIYDYKILKSESPKQIEPPKE